MANQNHLQAKVLNVPFYHMINTRQTLCLRQRYKSSSRQYNAYVPYRAQLTTSLSCYTSGPNRRTTSPEEHNTHAEWPTI